MGVFPAPSFEELYEYLEAIYEEYEAAVEVGAYLAGDLWISRLQKNRPSRSRELLRRAGQSFSELGVEITQPRWQRQPP
jgi:hypothetical protein